MKYCGFFFIFVRIKFYLEYLRVLVRFFFIFVLVIFLKLLVLKMVELEKGNWLVDIEVSFFYVMRGYKFVGMC